MAGESQARFTRRPTRGVISRQQIITQSRRTKVETRSAVAAENVETLKLTRASAVAASEGLRRSLAQ
jgi:hypothetical protein